MQSLTTAARAETLRSKRGTRRHVDVSTGVEYRTEQGNSVSDDDEVLTLRWVAQEGFSNSRS